MLRLPGQRPITFTRLWVSPKVRLITGHAGWVKEVAKVEVGCQAGQVLYEAGGDPAVPQEAPSVLLAAQ